ncbi:hypothetical protein BDW22DRAFT_731848 [Trametopsis cervina]|nr:hypothetical protein BDW22DRAFT_731848 [Trametopsis cervina]
MTLRGLRAQRDGELCSCGRGRTRQCRLRVASQTTKLRTSVNSVTCAFRAGSCVTHRRLWALRRRSLARGHRCRGRTHRCPVRALCTIAARQAASGGGVGRQRRVAKGESILRLATNTHQGIIRFPIAQNSISAAFSSQRHTAPLILSSIEYTLFMHSSRMHPPSASDTLGFACRKTLPPAHQHHTPCQQ